MFGKEKRRTDAGITLIAHNCEMSGDICFGDQLQVNGVVKGDIVAEDGSRATVTVSEKGRVKGNIRVPNVIVNGRVDGDIHSSKHIELAAKAEVTGNVYYNFIEMVRGSKVEGNLVSVRDGSEKVESGNQTTATEAASVDTEVESASGGSQAAPVNSNTG